MTTTTTVNTITIEGNIASGKSSLLNNFANEPNMVILPEPIERWKNWRGKNMLELMYQDPKKHMKKFQLMTQRTALSNHNALTSKPIKIMERSVYSSQHVFTQMHYEKGNLSKTDYEYICEQFSMNTRRMFHPDIIVYLRTDPSVCYGRKQGRNRPEEEGVSLEYLQVLHDYHERLLIRLPQLLPCQVVVIDGQQEPQKIKEDFMLVIKDDFKRCSRCKLNKVSSEYRKNQAYCKHCQRNYARVYMNEKYKDPQFYAIQLLRNQTSRVSDSGPSHEYLGCTHKFYLNWLNYQRSLVVNPSLEITITQPEEIDHVLPVAHFKSDLEIIFSWVNMSPISKSVNRSKRDKIDLDLFKSQIEKGIDFIMSYEFEDKFVKKSTIDNFTLIIKLIKERFPNLLEINE